MERARKIRIFVDARCFDKEHQGTRAFIKRLYIELAKTSPSLEFYFGANNIENLKSELEVIEQSQFVRYHSRFTLVRLLFEIPLIVRRHRIDLAHFQYIVPFIKNCKFILTTHDVIFKEHPGEFSFLYRFSRNILFGRSLKYADILTTVSNYSRKSIEDHFHVREGRMLVLPNGLNSDYLNYKGQENSTDYIAKKYGIQNYILYVSRFEPRKNHIALLKAFHELKLAEQGYSLVLLGFKSIYSADFENYFQQLAPEIKQRVYMSDKTNDLDLYHFYKGTRLFVYPSKAEGFGLPPVEAAALNVPVICSNLTAMQEYTFFGKNHIDPTDTEVLKHRMAAVLSHSPNEEELLQIAAEVRSRYHAGASAKTLYGAIHDLFNLSSAQDLTQTPAGN